MVIKSAQSRPFISIAKLDLGHQNKAVTSPKQISRYCLITSTKN